MAAVMRLSLSQQLRLTGLSHRPDLEGTIPIQLVRNKFVLRVHRLLPSDLLASVGSHTAHDPHQRAVRHPDSIVDGLSFANRGEKRVMLGLIHVIALCLKNPVSLPSDTWNGSASDSELSLGAE